MSYYGLLRLPFIVIIGLIFQATRWKAVQGVDYKVTIYIYNDAQSGSAAAVFGQLTGTTATTASVSFGKPWKQGSTTSHIIQHPTSIGFIKTIAISKSQTGAFNDDNLKLVKVTVESTAITGIVTFQCPNPYCNIRWPNLISRLHTAVDGGWSDWTLDCSCKGTNDAVKVRTCSNPPMYFGGKDCVGSTTEIIKDGCSQTICIPSTPANTAATPATTTTTDGINSRRPTTPPLTESFIKYGIPILATLVIIAVIITIALCVYAFCFAKKEKEETTTKPNQVVPHDGTVEHGSKPGKRPLVIKPVKHKPEGAGAPKHYTLPVFGPAADKRELFGDEAGSQTSLLREDSKSSTPQAASLPSLQGQEENLYTEVAAPKDELTTVGGVPTIVGATKWSTTRTFGTGPQRAIYRESVPHTISLPGNTIIRAGSVVESEDISEVT